MTNAFDVMNAQRQPVDQYTRALIQAPVNPALIKQNKYDKFGDGDYIDVETVSRLLNEVFGYVWSWEIIDFKHIKNDDGSEQFVVAHGRLSVPGVGVRDGIGQAKADKKDNSTMFSAASSFAFKSAAKRFGIAPNLFDKDGWNAGVDVFAKRPERPVGQPLTQPEVVSTGVKEAPTKERPPAPPAQNPVNNTPPNPFAESDAQANMPQAAPEKKIPETAAEKGAELRDAYNIKTKGQFVAFAQIWNPQITAFEQITPDVMSQLHQYVENNPEEFEDFQSGDYQ